jgi:heterodisulfide reductase subunit C
LVKKQTIREASFNFRDEVISVGSKFYKKEELERLRVCLQCGKCSGGCPSGRRTLWRIRKILEETSLGLKDQVFSDDTLWNCTTCYTCQERCPRGIPITDIVRVIRNLSVKSGRIKDSHKKICRSFIMSGHAVPINDEIKGVRKELGLDEIPPTVLSQPEGLKEVQEILKKTGFQMFIEEGQKK